MSGIEWWLQFGWYQLGIENFLVALVLAGVWVLVAADVYVFHRIRDRRGQGVLLGLPILTWALLACKQALDSTQIDMLGNQSRYPRFWSCIVASALAGLLVSASTLTSDRLLAAPGPYFGPSRGVVRCNIASLVVWLAVWSAAFAHEASAMNGAATADDSDQVHIVISAPYAGRANPAGSERVLAGVRVRLREQGFVPQGGAASDADGERWLWHEPRLDALETRLESSDDGVMITLRQLQGGRGPQFEATFSKLSAVVGACMTAATPQPRP